MAEDRTLFFNLLDAVANVAYDRGYYGPCPTNAEKKAKVPKIILEHKAETVEAIKKEVIENMVSTMVKTMKEHEQEPKRVEV